jgi:adenylate cyclase
MEPYGNFAIDRNHLQAAISILAEALTQVQDTGESYYEAELYRLKGELLFQQSKMSLEQVQDKPKTRQNKPPTGIKKSKDPNSQLLNPKSQTEAETCFQQAIALAQQQGAKSLELRATMSLARLWQQQGKKAEGHQMLSEVYNWFTEGFNTKDLREAKALLDALAA